MNKQVLTCHGIFKGVEFDELDEKGENVRNRECATIFSD